MRVRSVSSGLLLIAVVAACGGGTSPTQGPGAATQNPATTDGGGGATAAPVATDGGGGGNPAGWDQYGKLSFEISAPFGSGELGFVPLASHFESDQATSLSFTNEGSDTVIGILLTQGKLNISYGSPAGTVIGTNCTGTNMSIQQSSASGSFECTEALALSSAGAQVANVTLRGNFNVHS
ncbi:MAG: hypothetical protein ABI620_10515 [Chloroflexota bacterium]